MRLVIALLPALLLPLPALGQEARNCVIADPSPTPTNVRIAPAADLRGTIPNGTPVTIILEEPDAKSRIWAMIAAPGAKVVTGFVARDLIKCS